MNIKLYIQNYCYIEKIFYVSNKSILCFNQNTIFDLDIDNFIINEELFMNNRFKDVVTNRVFINGKAQSINSITQKGVEIDIKSTVFKTFENQINNFDNEVYNIADIKFKLNVENFKNDSEEFSQDEINRYNINIKKNRNMFKSESESDSDSGTESELDSKRPSKDKNKKDSDSDSENLYESDSDSDSENLYEYDSNSDSENLYDYDSKFTKKNKNYIDDMEQKTIKLDTELNVNNKMKLKPIKQTSPLKLTQVNIINLKNKKKIEKFLKLNDKSRNND